jgi:hypothetical protein
MCDRHAFVALAVTWKSGASAPRKAFEMISGFSPCGQFDGALHAKTTTAAKAAISMRIFTRR